MGFTASQAQFLIQFMRNLPGGAPQEPQEGEYEQAMAAQAMQAQQQAYAMMAPPTEIDHGAPGYEAPPFGYWDDPPPQW